MTLEDVKKVCRDNVIVTALAYTETGEYISFMTLYTGDIDGIKDDNTLSLPVSRLSAIDSHTFCIDVVVIADSREE